MLLRTVLPEVSLLVNQQKKKAKRPGPILALDIGERLVGAAITDELQITIKRLDPLRRSNWKRLLSDVKELIQRFDAQTLVIGLPLRLDGTTGSAAENVQRLAINFSRSLSLPVFLQDERLTSVEASESLRAEGYGLDEIPKLIDSEAAGVILRDYLNSPESHSVSSTPEKGNTT